MSAPRGIAWDSQPLGRVLDHELAARLGVATSAVAYARRRRGIAPMPRGHVERLGASTLVGTMPDAVLAERLGLPQTAVRDARRRRGIRMEQPRVEWGALDPLLGTAPDLHLARTHGASVAAVHGRRVAHGIPVYAPERRCACGAHYLTYQRSARFCSLRCSYAGRYGRRRGGHEDLSVALWALRREIRQRRTR